MNPFIKPSKQLSIFLTAGYPKLDSLKTQIPFLQESSIDFIEVGIPFSDPMADGLVIQESSALALKNGMNLSLIFEQLKQIDRKIPIVLMGYLNPILKYGIEQFLIDCASLEIASVILPDLSLEIYERFYSKLFTKYNIRPSFLITPTTPPERVRRIAEVCKNSFVYLVSSNATTGSHRIKIDQSEVYSAIKNYCGSTPLFVGFGIKSKDDVQKVQSVTDGAIIGSAYLQALNNNEESIFLASINNRTIQ